MKKDKKIFIGVKCQCKEPAVSRPKSGLIKTVCTKCGKIFLTNRRTDLCFRCGKIRKA